MEASPIDNAIWLFTALPNWFVSALLSPLSALAEGRGLADAVLFASIPLAGALCLVAGLVLAVRRREMWVYFFLVPAGLSQILVAVAGYYRGQFKDGVDGILVPFVALTVGLICLMIVKARRNRLAAVLLGGFCLSYAVFAYFIAAMAFVDRWL